MFGDPQMWDEGVPNNNGQDTYEAVFQFSDGNTVTIEQPNGQPYNPTSELLTILSDIHMDLAYFPHFALTISRRFASTAFLF